MVFVPTLPLYGKFDGSSQKLMHAKAVDKEPHILQCHIVAILARSWDGHRVQR